MAKSRKEDVQAKDKKSKSTMKPEGKNRLSMRKNCGTLPKNTLKKWQEEKHKDFD
ncbi:MAG: hypothetical protein ACTSRK_07625 [Promethearchaeota archaeon]